MRQHALRLWLHITIHLLISLKKQELRVTVFLKVALVFPLCLSNLTHRDPNLDIGDLNSRILV